MLNFSGHPVTQALQRRSKRFKLEDSTRVFLVIRNVYYSYNYYCYVSHGHEMQVPLVT